MITIGIDPGRKGGMAAIEGGNILFIEKFKEGLPFDGEVMPLRFTAVPTAIYYRHMNSGRMDAHYSTYHDPIFALEIPHIPKAEFGGKFKLQPDKIVMLGRYIGRLEQWLTERGVDEKKIKPVAPLTWQKILKGCLGANTKQRALWYLTKRFGEDELIKHGIIGPRGGYQDGVGDALCIACWLQDEQRQGGKNDT